MIASHPMSTFFPMRIIVMALILAGVFGTSLTAADTPGTPKKAKAYKIANTDRLRIAIVQEEELTSIVRVDAKGCVNLKYVGEVVLAGLIISDAEKAVESAYREGRYLRNPQVTINVEEYAQREVSIQGEVRNAGRFPLPAETVMTVLDLVTRAGGFSDTAKGTEVKVTRFAPDGKVAKVFVVNVESIIKGKGGKKNDDTSIELEPGDVVFVPQRII
jgi:polysaccharide biosynthesis/export protein